MYDKSDPRSALATAKRDETGTTAVPASYGLYYKDDPVDNDANGKSWYTRSQNLIVNYIESKPGARFARAGQVDEYMIVLPDDDTPYEISANGASVQGDGHQLIIVPPGDSAVVLPKGGRVVRLFTTQSADLAAKCANAETYAQPDPANPPFKPWPAPPSGFKLRVYDLQKTRKPGELGPIWRCTTIMLNFPPPGGGPRDITKMSPHSHFDFDQCSLVLGGSFRHNMRWPWGLNKNDWRADEFAEVGSPSATMIPARVIHSSESLMKEGN
ncbi:MAG TPA: hypothetical protein VGB91_08055, partial [Rhizomicrobium sp.]